MVDDTGVSRTRRHATFGDQPTLLRRAGLTKPKVLFTAAIWKAADHALEAFTLTERAHDLANAGWCDGTDRRFRRQPRYLAAV